jgi:hypothetical protein
MAVSIVTTPGARTAAVLRFTVVAGATVITRIVRSDSNGTNAVRLPAGQLPASGDIAVEDYEASMLTGTPITYYAYDAVGLVAQATVTDEPTFANTVPGLVYLTCPPRPGLGRALNTGARADEPVVTSYDARSVAASTVHRVVDRVDPVVILRTAPLPEGVLQITCPSLATAQGIRFVLAQPYTFMLRQSDQNRLDFHFVVTGTGLTHNADPWGTVEGRLERRWTLDVSYTEIATPPEEVTRTAAWTYADLTAAHATYVAVQGTYATYLDLSRNTPRDGL